VYMGFRSLDAKFAKGTPSFATAVVAKLG
jgi:hypothetical protein